MEEIKTIAKNNQFIALGRSGKGGRKENQDCYGGFVKDNILVMTVCDGMGGNVGGQTASYLAVEAILTTLSNNLGQDIPNLISKAIINANDSIYQRAVEEPSLRGMGTTATIMVISPEAAWLTHIGDSRIYQLRKEKKVFRTFDHSKVFDMVASGIITEEQARRSSFSNIITKALGIKKTVDDFDIVKIPYKKGDRMILCCDGIWNTLPEPEMLKHFNKYADTAKEIAYLTDMVNRHGIDEGNHHDNLTAIIADMRAKSNYQPSFWNTTISRIKRFMGKEKKSKTRVKAFIISMLMSLSLNTYAQKTEWLVSPGTFSSIEYFAPNMYKVEKSGKVGIIGTDGKVIIPAEYDAINLFYEGRAIFVNDSEYGWKIMGVLNEDATVSYTKENYYAIPEYMIFSEGYLPVRNSRGEYGYLNENMNIAFPFSPYKITPFSEGIATIGEGDDFCWINTEGEQIWIKLPNGAYPYGGTNIYEGNRYAWDQDGKCFIINNNGKIQKIKNIEDIPDLDYIFRPGTGLGENIPYSTFTPQYEHLWQPTEKNGTWSYMDRAGKIISPYIYDNAQEFINGVAIAQQHGKTGLLHVVADDETFSISSPSNTFVYSDNSACRCRIRLFTPEKWKEQQLEVSLKDAENGQSIAYRVEDGSTYAFDYRPSSTNKTTNKQFILNVKSNGVDIWSGDKDFTFVQRARLISSIHVNNATANAENRCIVSAHIKNPSGIPVSTTVTLSGGGTTTQFSNKTVSITIPPHSSKTISSSFYVKKVELKGWCSVTTSDGKGARQSNLELAPF